MTSKTLEQIDKLRIQYPAVEELYTEYLSVVESSVYSAVMTLEMQLADWNKQLTIDGEEGKINLLADKSEVAFNRALSYFKEIIPLYDTLDKLKSRLKPKEAEDMEKTKAASKVGGVAI